MTFPAMHPSEAVAPHSARGQNSSLLNQAVAASVHGGISHSHSSSSHAKTSAALSSQRAHMAATAALAEQAGFPANHRSDYLSDDEDKRELPAKYIRAFEYVCGNTAISQWIAMGAKLTVLEEIQAGRLAA